MGSNENPSGINQTVRIEPRFTPISIDIEKPIILKGVSPRARQIAIPCDCIGSCSIALFTEWEQYGGSEQECFVEFYRHTQIKRFRKSILKDWWNFIRGKEISTGGVSLDYSKICELRDFLIEVTEPTEKIYIGVGLSD